MVVKLLNDYRDIAERNEDIDNLSSQGEEPFDSDVEMNSPSNESGMGNETLRLMREAREDDDDEVGDVTFQLLREAEEDGLFFPSTSTTMHQRNISSRGTQTSITEEVEDDEDADADADEDDDEDEDEQEEATSTSLLTHSVASHLQQSILKDKQLYRRILMFEPVALDEVMSVARRNGVKVKDRIQVRSWLDEHGITNYSEELTGKRSRH